jgi:hypothetical protein
MSGERRDEWAPEIVASLSRATPLVAPPRSADGSWAAEIRRLGARADACAVGGALHAAAFLRLV